MAVGKTGRVFPGKSYTVKLKLKEGTAFLDTPEWEFQSPPNYEALTHEQTKALFNVDGPIRDVNGTFVGLDARVSSFEDKPIHNVTVFLEDTSKEDEADHEQYRVQFTANNNLGRSIANIILNLRAGVDTQIGLYSQVNKALGKTFAACSLRQAGSTDTVKKKYDPKTAPELQPREFEGVGGKLTKDWTKVDAFFLAELIKFGEALKANRGQQSSASASAQEAPKAETPASEPAPTENSDDAGPPF